MRHTCMPWFGRCAQGSRAPGSVCRAPYGSGLHSQAAVQSKRAAHPREAAASGRPDGSAGGSSSTGAEEHLEACRRQAHFSRQQAGSAVVRILKLPVCLLTPNYIAQPGWAEAVWRVAQPGATGGVCANQQCANAVQPKNRPRQIFDSLLRPPLPFCCRQVGCVKVGVSGRAPMCRGLPGCHSRNSHPRSNAVSAQAAPADWVNGCGSQSKSC